MNWEAFFVLVTRFRPALIGLVILASFHEGRAEIHAFAPKPPKLEITTLRSRKTKIDGGDWDDKTERVGVEIRIRNLELNRSCEGCTVHYWVVGRSAVDPKVYKVIQRASFPLNLTNTREGREIVHASEEVVLKWDKTDAKFGERYDGWLVVVENGEGEVVAVKSSRVSWEKDFRKAFGLDEEACVNVQLDPVAQPRR